VSGFKNHIDLGEWVDVDIHQSAGLEVDPTAIDWAIRREFPTMRFTAGGVEGRLDAEEWYERGQEDQEENQKQQSVEQWILTRAFHEPRYWNFKLKP